jgi:hypothetical protein
MPGSKELLFPKDNKVCIIANQDAVSRGVVEVSIPLMLMHVDQP